MNKLSKEEREYLEKQLGILMSRWKILEEKRAKFGGRDFPAFMQIELDEVEAEIREISNKLGISPPFERLKIEIQSVSPSILKRLRNRLLEYLSATIFAGINRKKYLRKLIAYHKEFSLLSRPKPLDLEKIYVALRISEHVPLDYKPDEQVSQKASLTLEVKDALPISRRLVVLGNPGSGKTTLLHYLALQAAKKNKMLSDFSLKLIPTPTARILKAIHRILSGFDSQIIAVFSILVFPIVGLVSACWKVSSFWMAVALSLLIVLFMLLIVVRLNRKVTFILSILTLGILSFWTLYPSYLLPPATLISGWIVFGLILYPFWIQLPLTLVSFLLDYATHYPLPIYLTLNNLTGDEQDIEAHLKNSLREYGFPYPGRFLSRELARGRCLILLDALDEVVEDNARQRVTREINAISKRYGDKNQIMVTCRLAGFHHQLDRFLQMEVAEFDQQQIERFINSWFEDEQDTAEGLIKAIGRSQRLWLLATNPLLLSIIAIVYEQNWRFPERRVDLYDECVQVLIKKWKKEIPKKFSPELKRTVLRELALHFHLQQKRVFSLNELKAALNQILNKLKTSEEQIHPDEFLKEILERTGLIRQKSRTTYDFIHLTFQEFLTAEALHQAKDIQTVMKYFNDAWWQEVILLYSALLEDAVDLICEFQKSDLFLASKCLADAKLINSIKFQEVKEDILNKLRTLLETDTAKRQEAADSLVEINDPQYLNDLKQLISPATSEDIAVSVLLALFYAAPQEVVEGVIKDIGYILKLLNSALGRVKDNVAQRVLSLLDTLRYPMVYIPAGEFIRGSNEFINESPQQNIYLDAYYIDKYPVTNAQFQQFIEATKYQTQGNWKSEFKSGKERHPVVKVSYNDALAYYQWVGKHLPTEAQWEKAARGTDNRRYPWGNKWDAGKANINGRGTTPVDAHPEGVSPYGCYDMAGNVWEWCSDWYAKDYYKNSPAKNPKGPDSGRRRVLRGGSWLSIRGYARCTYRYYDNPGSSGSNVGFRCARTL